MIKYLLFILALIYICTILHRFFKIKDTDFIINVIEEYLSSVKPDSYGNIQCLDNYDDCLSKLLFYYPKIVEYFRFYTLRLEYGAPPKTTYENATKIYKDLLMKRNYIVSSFLKAFNPIVSVKIFLRIPSTFLNLIGFDFKEGSIKFINLIGWSIAYFLNLYGEEIKALISSILTNCFNA